MPEFAAGLGFGIESEEVARIPYILAVDPDPDRAMIRAAWLVENDLRKMVDEMRDTTGYAVRMVAVRAQDAQTLRVGLRRKAREEGRHENGVVGLDGNPEVEAIKDIRAILPKVARDSGERFNAADAHNDDCAELSIDRKTGRIQIW